MKQLLLFLPILLLCFTMSCDHRTSAKERLEISIAEFGKKQTALKVQSFYPESYTEVKTDSIIANTFKVSISNYSNMNKNLVLTETNSEKNKISKLHRVFESDVLIAVNDKLIFQQHLSAADFKDTTISDFWNNATLEQIWVNQEQSNQTELLLGVSIINPKSKAYKYYEMRFDHAGKKSIQLIEENS